LNERDFDLLRFGPHRKAKIGRHPLQQAGINLRHTQIKLGDRFSRLEIESDPTAGLGAGEQLDDPGWWVGVAQTEPG
jgi:hypothetical protein